MSFLIRIQTVWHSDGVPEIIFFKVILKKTTDRKKYPVGKEINIA